MIAYVRYSCLVKHLFFKYLHVIKYKELEVHGTRNPPISNVTVIDGTMPTLPVLGK